MKIRSGFVSNSSSSSFVVKYKTVDYASQKYKYQCRLTEKQIKLLKKYGFKYTKVNNPYFVDTSVSPFEKTLKSFKKWDEVYLGYSVICNQDDVIYFLLNNKIPFVALCHYDEELVFWDGEGEWFYEMPNPVEKMSRNIGVKKFTDGFDVKTKKIKIADWIDKEKAYMSSLV